MRIDRWPSCVAFVLIVGCSVSAPASADDRDACARASGEEAIAACTRAIGSPALKGSGLSKAHVSRGHAYYIKGDHDHAIADYAEAIRLDPKSAVAFRNRANAYRAKGDNDRAIVDYSEAIRLDPKSAAAWRGRGSAYYAKGDYDRAIADDGEAIRLDPTLAAAFASRGNAYYAKGDLDRAIADYSDAIRLDPKLVAAFNSRGNAYYATGNQDRAIADYGEAIRLDPKLVTAFGSRGNAHYAKGDHDRAIADYGEQIRLDPKSSMAFRNRGNAYYAKGDHDRAIADYGEAINLDPKNAAAFSKRGMAYIAKGDQDRAAADYGEAIRLDPKLDHWIGLRIQRVSDETAQRLGMKQARGALVISVDAAGPAKSAGIEPGDVIVRFDGKDVNEFRDLPRMLADTPPGKEISATVVRRGNEESRTLRIGLRAAMAPPAAEGATASPSAAPAKRVALVIGNGAYPGAARLANPVNDADDVTVALRQVGFDVIEGKDLALAGFSRVISDFADKAKSADVALIYYAGHAMQFEETNWLLPVDARITNAFDMRHSSVSLQDLMTEVETRAKTTLIFLDACRNNPIADEFRSRLKAEGRAFAETRGLARVNVDAPQMMVVYATRPNAIAADGHRRNSPFTEAFLRHLPTPGVEIEVLMKRVTAAVSASTGGKQQPERLSRLEREFYFVPAK